MVAIAGFSSTALRPLLLRVLFPQVPAQGAYPRAGGAGPECQHLGLILASISSPPCRSRSRCRTRKIVPDAPTPTPVGILVGNPPGTTGSPIGRLPPIWSCFRLRLDLDTVKTLQLGTRAPQRFGRSSTGSTQRH